MNAKCLVCGEFVECDALDCVDGHEFAVCPGGSRCMGDDMRADDAYNDPRTGQAEWINAHGRNRR